MEQLMMNGPMMGGFGMVFGMGLMLLVWVGIFYLVYRLSKLLFGRTAATPSISALDALKKRYADGEINDEQFQKIKNNLQASEE